MKYSSVVIMSQLLAFIKTDNLVLLSGTLRQFEQTGCDDDQMTLKCPPGTSISVELAQYDKTQAKNSRCPSKATPAEIKNNSCLWPTAIQNKWEEMTKGTWGRTVVEACQKKKSCKFQASPRSFDGDLCQGERKYVEVAYKCRPYEFRRRMACENERVHLQCNPNSRVAIYSASYGRTEYEHFQCPQPQGVAEETCLVSYATETVMQLCHGKRHCEFGADSTTFGSPCRPQTRMYLRIVYTCVPQKVLNAEYEEPLGEDETEQDFTYDQEDFDGLDSTKERIREFAAPNLKQVYKHNDTAIGSHENLNITITKEESTKLTVDTPGAGNSGNPEENIYLYVIMTFGVASLLCVIIVTSRALVRRHHDVPAATAAKFQATNPPSTLTEVELGNQLDIGTPLPMHHLGLALEPSDAVHVHCHQHPPRIHAHNSCTMTDGYYYG